MPRSRTKAEQKAYDKKHREKAELKSVKKWKRPSRAKPPTKPKLKIADKATRVKRVKAGYAKDKKRFKGTRTQEIAEGHKSKNPYKKGTPEWRKYEREKKK